MLADAEGKAPSVGLLDEYGSLHESKSANI